MCIRDSSKVAEAGAIIAGGHSISDPEPKYGLCVSGFIAPDKILTNNGAQIGDKIILTKPLGSGIMVTAAKGELIDADSLKPTIEVMATLNRRAAEIAAPYPLHACTDVTGFGLLGHALEMVGDNDKGMIIDSSSLPLIDGAYEMAEMGLVPAGAYTTVSYTHLDVYKRQGVVSGGPTLAGKIATIAIIVVLVIIAVINTKKAPEPVVAETVEEKPEPTDMQVAK